MEVGTKWHERSPKFRSWKPSGHSNHQASRIPSVALGLVALIRWYSPQKKNETCGENACGWHRIFGILLECFFRKPFCSRTENVQIRLGHPHPLLSLFPPEHGQHPSSIATVRKPRNASYSHWDLQQALVVQLPLLFQPQMLGLAVPCRPVLLRCPCHVLYLIWICWNGIAPGFRFLQFYASILVYQFQKWGELKKIAHELQLQAFLGFRIWCELNQPSSLPGYPNIWRTCRSNRNRRGCCHWSCCGWRCSRCLENLPKKFGSLESSIFAYHTIPIMSQWFCNSIE